MSYFHIFYPITHQILLYMEHVRIDSIRVLFDKLQASWSDTTSLPQILDPITSIARLAMLSFMPHGTKIAITNHRISIHPPTVLQGAIRWVSGFERGDCHMLLRPIERAVLLYNDSALASQEDIIPLFELARKGLENLRTT